MLDLKLSYDEALELLNKAVEDKGEDYIYLPPGRDGCVYFNKGKPSCIVGHVLAAKGVKSTDLNSAYNGSGVTTLDIAEDERASLLLIQAQLTQDGGEPWGEAVKTAVRYVNHVMGDANVAEASSVA